MERAATIFGSVAPRGCSPIRRLLTQVGLNLLGLSDDSSSPEEVTWWDDSAKIRGRRRDFESAFRSSEPEQVELWRDRALSEPACAPAPAAVAAAVEPAPSQPSTPNVAAAETHSKKGNGMSMFAIAKFLHVSGSLYDGDDERRWLALPPSKSRPQFQLTQHRQSSTDNCRTLRALPRDFASRANGTWLSA